jgi:hypothetical protein
MTERQSSSTTAASEEIDRDAMYVIARVYGEETLLIRSSSEHNQRDSPLLRLPAELRNHIWDYVFPGITFYISGPDHPTKDKTKFLKVKGYKRRLVPGLLYVCRQIYGETRFHLLRRSTFWMRRACAFMMFLDLLSDEQRNAIEVINTDTGALEGLFGNGPPMDDHAPDFWTWVTDGAWSVDMSLLKFALFEKLGGLKRLQLQVYCCRDMKSVRAARRIVKMAFKQLGAANGVRLRLQVEKMHWKGPNRRWVSWVTVSRSRESELRRILRKNREGIKRRDLWTQQNR